MHSRHIGSQPKYSATGEGTGLLRLHSTYRHDLKIYSSDEGRVQVLISSLSSQIPHMLAIFSLGDSMPFLKLYSRFCILRCMMALLRCLLLLLQKAYWILKAS